MFIFIVLSCTDLVEFTDEEGYGRYLDLHDCYLKYINLKGSEVLFQSIFSIFIIIFIFLDAFMSCFVFRNWNTSHICHPSISSLISPKTGRTLSIKGESLSERVIVYLLSVRNKAKCDMLAHENNPRCPDTWWSYSYHVDVDYFPVTARFKATCPCG